MLHTDLCLSHFMILHFDQTLYPQQFEVHLFSEILPNMATITKSGIIKVCVVHIHHVTSVVLNVLFINIL